MVEGPDPDLEIPGSMLTHHPGMTGINSGDGDALFDSGADGRSMTLSAGYAAAAEPNMTTIAVFTKNFTNPAYEAFRIAPTRSRDRREREIPALRSETAG